MNNIYLFDVDGTLTEPRQPMGESFAKEFRLLIRDSLVYLVSGSDLGKLQEQLPADILRNCSGVFSSSANQLNIGGQLIYKNKLDISPELSEFFKTFLEKSEYNVRTGTHTELRPGMINFSVVGREATGEQRKAYAEWDNKNQERKRAAILLMAAFPNLEATIGGEISIDIYPEGLDKRQSVEFLRNKHPNHRICFFGDRTGKHGNDYSVVISLGHNDRVHTVSSHLQTKELIDNYLRGENFE
jgi:phosphomannomutase